MHNTGASTTAHDAVPITEEDFARAHREARQPTDADIEEARRRYGGSALADQPGARPSSPPSPRLEVLPPPLTRQPVDLEAIARGYASLPSVGEAFRPQRGPGLLVFVTLSMPRTALVRLFDQASRSRATVVLQGLANGSLRETVALVQPLIAGRQVDLQIDPQAFDRFAVTRAPTFVLIKDGTRPESCAAGTCAPPSAFVQAAGDVSLEYALDQMVRAHPTFRADAQPFAARLRQERR